MRDFRFGELFGLRNQNPNVFLFYEPTIIITFYGDNCLFNMTELHNTAECFCIAKVNRVSRFAVSISYTSGSENRELTVYTTTLLDFLVCVCVEIKYKIFFKLCVLNNSAKLL